MRKLGLLPGLLTLLLCASSGAAQEVFRNVTSDKLEALLKELNISARKAASKNDGVFSYYFKQDNFEVRLLNYGGKDLWIDCVFTDKVSAETINRWNLRSRSTRAVLIKDGTQESVSFEAQVDCLGGITDPIIKRFILRFNTEVNEFSKFISK